MSLQIMFITPPQAWPYDCGFLHLRKQKIVFAHSGMALKTINTVLGIAIEMATPPIPASTASIVSVLISTPLLPMLVRGLLAVEPVQRYPNLRGGRLQQQSLYGNSQVEKGPTLPPQTTS